MDMSYVFEKIPQQIIYVLRKLDIHNYEAYIVGGAVRDLILGLKEPNDWDIATDAPYERILQIFENSKLVGESFGVVLVNVDGLEIQIAQYRVDGEYKDFRHPNEVLFVNSIHEDLKRRDLTINAIGINPLYDGFFKTQCVYVENSLEDIEKGLIRFVGNVEDRIKEDPLRMLRAIRFSCQLEGFTMDKEIEDFIYSNSLLIKNISVERIREELNKILLSTSPDFGIYLLVESGLLIYIIPELLDCINVKQNKHHKYDIFGHILQTVKFSKQSLSMRLAALFHDIGKPLVFTVDDKGEIHFYNHEEYSAQIAENVLKRLKYDNKTIEEVVYLVKNHMVDVESIKTDKQIRRLLNKHGCNRLKELILLKKADYYGNGMKKEQEIDNLINHLLVKVDAVESQNHAISYEQLAINGDDIMTVLGISSGKKVGEIKKRIMDLVLDCPCLNKKDLLLKILTIIK